MKKLIIALLVAIAIASMTEAAAFKWSTAGLYAPNADGSISSTTAASATGTWTATVLLYSDAGRTTTVEGLTGNTGSTVNQMNSAITGTFGGATFAFDGKTQYYAVLELTYKTEAGTQTLTTDVVSTTLKTTGNTTLSFQDAISNASWSAIPEPTSGLLVLFGMAGLALRRKRA